MEHQVLLFPLSLRNALHALLENLLLIQIVAQRVQKVGYSEYIKYGFSSKKLLSYFTGASCNGDTFIPNTNGSLWRIESSYNDGNIRHMCLCPAGYTMTRND
jgi:hypothetical protein